MKYKITGGEVQIDEEDLELVTGRRWHINSGGYAVWRGNLDGRKQTLRMHRLIARCPDELIVDHLNHDRLDNRRTNLRVTTQSENLRNKTDQGKGYWYQKQNRNWVVEINGIHRGTFAKESEAASFANLVRDGLADKKPRPLPTHCKHGHSLADSYEYNGHRLCRKCQSIRSAAYYQRKNRQQ